MVFSRYDQSDKIPIVVQWDGNRDNTLEALEKFMSDMHFHERPVYLIPAQHGTCLRYRGWGDVTKHARFASVPAYVEKIDSWSFDTCSAFVRITFSMSSLLTQISANAFNCSSLVEITIPDSLVTIATRAFYKCKSLERVRFGPAPSLKSIGKEAFFMSGLTEIEIPDSVQVLDCQCFYKSPNLEHVFFRNNPSLKQIGRGCFAFCSLTSFSLPPSVKSIGGGAFTQCPMLNFVISANNSLFTICNDLLLSSNKRVCYGQIGCSSEIFVPDCVENISDGCFSDSQTLSFVHFGEDSSLKRIGAEAFYGSSIQRITIPKDVGVLGKKCFEGCQRLFNVTFESSCPALKQLDDKVFARCDITSIEIPDNVERLGDGCFLFSTSLAQVKFGKDSALKVIGVNCFSGSGITSFRIPRSVQVIGGSAFSSCNSLVNVNCDDSDNFRVSKSLLLSKDRRVCYSPIGNLLTAVIPDSVEDIADMCFFNAYAPRYLVFGQKSNLKRIGAMSFSGHHGRGAYLREVELPRGVEELGNRCFGSCRDLAEVRFLNIRGLKRIGTRPFVGCLRVHPALQQIEAAYGIKLR